MQGISVHWQGCGIDTTARNIARSFKSHPLQGHHHPDTKTKQRQHTQKRKLQANITDVHRCKNPQQIYSKQDSTTH